MHFLASLRTRLALSHLAVSLLSILLIALFAGGSIYNAARQELENNLTDLVYTTGSALEAPLQAVLDGSADIAFLGRRLERLFAAHPEADYTIYWVDGSPVISSSATPAPVATRADAPHIWTALNEDSGLGRVVRTNPEDQQVLYLARRIDSSDQAIGVLQVSRVIDPPLILVGRDLQRLFLVSLFAALAVSLFGWWVASWLTNSIRYLNGAAEQFAQGNLDQRVAPSGPQELRQLANSFNHMADRIQAHINELRAFTANASHELRTPLTIVKLRVEALREGALHESGVAERFLAEVEDEVDRLSSMVNDLLDLSRMEAGLAPKQYAPIDLSEIVCDVYDSFRIRAEAAGVQLMLAPSSATESRVSGNEDQLRRVLYNLVDNAIRYTRSGGTVEIAIITPGDGDPIRLEVRDTGIGIPDEHLPHIFERFYRADATRPRSGKSRGSGLGLAIARSIIEYHGGNIGVQSQLGRGSTFWIELPRLPETPQTASKQ